MRFLFGKHKFCKGDQVITPSFGLTATERVLPKLALDFTTASLDSRITFTRALNTATRVNSSGYVETVNADTARFDFDPVTLACKGLLIEESRQNLLTYSEEFDQGAWGKFGASIGQDVETSPSNVLNGDKLIEDTSNGLHRMLRDTTTSTSNTYSFTIFAKPAGRNILTVIVKEPVSSSGAYARFNVSTGAISTGATITASGTNASASITPYKNGWYRCNLTVTPNGGGTLVRTEVQLNNGSADSYQGDGTSGIYLWGADLETGAFPTSYIPTTTTSLTRNADVATMTGTNFSSWFNASEGSFEVDAAFNNMVATNSYMFNVDDGTVNNRYSFWRWTGNSKLFCTVITSSSNVAQVEKAAAMVANTYYNSTLGYKENDFGASFSGVATQTDTSLTLPTVNTLRFSGQDSSNTNPFNGWWRKLLYWPQKLTSAELQAFSK